jgi:hypothetical protein
MAGVQLLDFDSPDETRAPDKTRVDLVRLGDTTAARFAFEPGWKWSECVKPVAGTDSCQVSHLIYTVSGQMVVRMDDGSETAVKTGDVTAIPPGHDAWIVGDEPYVGIDFQGGGEYAKPQG